MRVGCCPEWIKPWVLACRWTSREPKYWLHITVAWFIIHFPPAIPYSLKSTFWRRKVRFCLLNFSHSYGPCLSALLSAVTFYLYSSAGFGGFPGGSDGKEPACNGGDMGSIPGSGRSAGEGNGNPLHHSCIEYSMDGGAWCATVHGVAKSLTQLSN